MVNILRHHIDFVDVIRIFEDTKRLNIIDDRKNYNEIRMRTIGKVQQELVIVVVHTDRNGRTRIISARYANKKKGNNIMSIISHTQKIPSQTDWNLLRNMQDKDIDYSDIPETSDEMFSHAIRGNITTEKPIKVTIQLSPSLLNDFRHRIGKDWRNHLSGNVETWLREAVI